MTRKSKYHQRPDGLLETTRTDSRTGKRIHFYGHSDLEIDRQIMDYTSKQERGRLFKEVATEWRDQHFPTLSPTTSRGYKPAYARALDEFGGDPIRQIKALDIKRFIDDFSRGGRARKTVRNQLLLLSLIFGYAVEVGDLEYSPCDHVTIKKNLPKRPRAAASPEDEEKIKKSADLWLLPYFILYTGLRRGEALALTWSDIDLETKEIHVTKSLCHAGGAPYIKTPKTAAGVRVVPILDPLLRVLPPPGLPQNYLFSIHGGEKPLTSYAYESLWKKFAEATGITCTAHQLRHSFATMLFECGIDVKDAQGLLGHASIAMTQDIYTHLRDQRRKNTAKTLNEKLKEVEEKSTASA